MYQICCIGHITLDKIVTPRKAVHMPGGTAFYFSHAIRNMAVDYMLVTAVAESELQNVADLRTADIEVKALPSAHSIYFENIYDENQDNRTQRVLQKADAFNAAQVMDIEAEIYHLGPLLADDIPVDMIRALSARGRVSLDAQGYLREVVGTEVRAIDWAEKEQALQYVEILKVNDHELAVLTGTADMRRGAMILADWGVKEVVITLGSKGSLIYAGGGFYEIPVYKAADVVDATGCGDTYMAGYLARRVKGDDIPAAGKFASAMAALKIEQTGAFKGTEQDVFEMVTRR